MIYIPFFIVILIDKRGVREAEREREREREREHTNTYRYTYRYKERYTSAAHREHTER